MNKEIGRPAFPVPGLDRNLYNNGMTLRDYFAAKAMQSMLADDAYSDRTETAVEWIATVAKASYEMADSMIKARKGGAS